MKTITKSLFESLDEQGTGMTLKEYALKFKQGYLDNDVSDTDIDMLVAFVHDFNETPKDSCEEFNEIIGERAKIVSIQDHDYGEQFVCDFSSIFKPYNEQLKEFFNMDNSEFREEEAYYEAVDNLEALLSGNATESQYKELNDILKSNTSEITNEADNMESTIDEAARYLFDEGDSDYLPDYEEFNDSTMEIPKDLFDKAKERALEALTTLAEHNYYDHENNGQTYLELNSNHTLWELEDDGMPFDDEGYTFIVQQAADDFEEQTGTKMYFLGRSARHVCVEPTYDNCMNFEYLQELQEKLEQGVIDAYNADSKQWKEEQEKEDMNESKENKYYIDLDLGFQYDINSLDELPKEADIRTDYKNIKCSIPKTNVLRIVGSKPTLERIIKNSDFDKDEDIPEIKSYNMNESIKRIKHKTRVIKEQALTESIDEGKIASFIKDSVDKLQNTDYTNCKYDLDDKFALYVGWSDGYDAEDTNEYEIHSKKNPTHCINAVIGLRNDADWSDLDYINRPYYEAGDVYEAEWTVSPHEDYSYLANSIIKTYGNMLELLDAGELLTEDNKVNYKEKFIEYCKDKIDNKLGYTVYYGFIDPEDGKDAREYMEVDSYEVDFIEDGKIVGFTDTGNMNYTAFYLDNKAKKPNSEDTPYTYRDRSKGPQWISGGDGLSLPEYISHLSFDKISKRIYDNYIEHWNDDEGMDLWFNETNNLTEDASIDDDPDLDREQVNTDVDYWSDVDEANTEDVSDMKPVGVYGISNTGAIYVYKIEYGIDDKVLVGDSSDTTKARWTNIIYDDLVDENTGEPIPFFWYGDIKVPFNEVMRTDM